MKDSNWELIAKHLAEETNLEEEKLFSNLLATDLVFKQEYKAANNTWNRMEIPTPDFNKTRIERLRDQKIKASKQRKILSASLKYAALFIGFVMGALFIYHDLNSTITVVAENGTKMEITLPDGSLVMMKKNAKITYANSILKSFDRMVTLQGQAYFEIKKAHGKNFVVKTNEYNIEVLGTKFNVNTNLESTSVVLAEGSIALNHFKNPTLENTKIVPGQMALINRKDQNLIINTVNPKIYTSWTTDQLDFDDFSISELGELFRIHYNKTLTVESSLELDQKVGGSAPTDDLKLIIRGLSLVLKREIIERNDTIIIK